MPRTPKQAAALILARMALSDGVIDPAERRMLAEVEGLSVDDPAMDQLLADAREVTLQELTDDLKPYADRFFVALRAYIMAHIDAHFDVAEEAFFHRLTMELGITASDQAVIQQIWRNIYEQDDTPHPRVLELYPQSSFHQERR